MERAELKSVLSKFGKSLNDVAWTYEDFKTSAKALECCPECGAEVEITQDAKSDCSECGHKEVLPCSGCPLLELAKCDWNEKSRCSMFPK